MSVAGVGRILKSNKELLHILELYGIDSGDERSVKKLNEVVGFCEQIFRIIKDYPKEEIVFFEGSCGKSYVSFALNYLIDKLCSKKAYFYGVDTNEILIEKCDRIREALGYENMYFIHDRIIDAQPKRDDIDMVIALHACDIASDEVIAKGIKLNAKYITVVPCCENQIRGRLKSGHPLKEVTDFGLLRYRFADILTEALRAQFLTGAGYHVKMVEIVPVRWTPKNLMIIARKKKVVKKNNMEKYKKLDEMFNTDFILKEYFPEYNFDSACCLDPLYI